MVNLKISVKPARKFQIEIALNRVEIEGFSQYVVTLEGSQLTSKDQSPKKLVLEIGLDGALLINIEKVSETLEGMDIVKRLLSMLPRGYELYHVTESARVIGGVRGRYYHFKHRDTGDFVSFNIGAKGKPYRISLGSLEERGSPIRTVLENIPYGPFKKANLVHHLPQSIVENRQPIKAALDILEKEGYVRRISSKGISEEYVRTDKPMPQIAFAPKLQESIERR